MSKDKGEVVTTSEGSNLPAVPSYVEELDGGGLENARMTDFQVARLQLMQGSSPEVAKGLAVAGELLESVEGTKVAGLVGEGENSTGETIEIVPCYHYLEWFEWHPRNSGKGIKARSIDPKGSLAQSVMRGEMVQVDGRDKFKVTEYHNFVCLLPGWSMTKPIVLSCSSSQIKKARQLLTLLRYRGAKVPMFSCKFAQTTVREHKQEFTYWNYEFVNDGFASEKEYVVAKAIHDEVRKAYKEMRLVVDLPEGADEVTGVVEVTAPTEEGAY